MKVVLRWGRGPAPKEMRSQDENGAAVPRAEPQPLPAEAPNPVPVVEPPPLPAEAASPVPVIEPPPLPAGAASAVPAAEAPPVTAEATAEQSIIEKQMLEATGASDPGCVRSNNEDYFLVAPSIGLYLVADGMGGAQAGEHASKLAAETVWEVVYQNNGSVTPELLVSAFEEANRRILEAANANPEMEGMGTTLVAAVDTSSGLLIASVGDSRAYVYENGELQTITDDQTWVNEVGRRLGLSEDALKTHPMRHVLTMAVGVSPALRVNTYTVNPAPGMQVLLCSDGLHGVAPESALKDAMASEASLEDKCKTLIEAARSNGGPDNVTVVLMRTA